MRLYVFGAAVILLIVYVVCVQVDSEEPVFEAVLNWVKHNRKEREPYLPDMLEFVRLPLLTPRYITDVIDAEVSQLTHCRGFELSCTELPVKKRVSVDVFITLTFIIKRVLTRLSPSLDVACRVETSWMRPRNSTCGRSWGVKCRAHAHKPD